MAEWLVEHGIGEHRAVLLHHGCIQAARLDWPGSLTAGQIEDAVLISRSAGSSRGTARFGNGEDALVDRLPRGASQGATLRLEVMRSAMAEAGRTKLAAARPTSAAPRPAPSLFENLKREGAAPRIVNAFPDCDWDELWDEAALGVVGFAGGALHFSPTPAMTVIDVDGTLSPRELALAAVKPLAAALLRFDLGGNIGIDFPTLSTRSDRRAVDDAVAQGIDGWPHERTAMNGFGFVQLVARLVRPSLLHRLHFDYPGASARRLLRRAEQVAAPGAILLSCHPAIAKLLQQAWLTELARRTGRVIRISPDPALALESGFAQAVPL